MDRRIEKGGRQSAAGAGRDYGSLGGEPSAASEAESNLQSLLSSLSNPSFELKALPGLMRTYLLSLRLLGLDDKWVIQELKGYPTIEKVPSYRKYYCDTKYVEADSDKLVEQTRETYYFDDAIAFMVDKCEKGWVQKSEGPKKRLAGNAVSTKRVINPSQWEVNIILEQIAEELFDRASKTLVTARFGSAIDTIFRDYQKVVSSTLSKLDIQDHLDTAYRNLKGGNEASWRAAALACRNILQDLSAKLWCVKSDEYDMGGKPMSVKSDKPCNRLRAYMHVKGLQSDYTSVALLNPIYAQASAAKAECSYEHARSVLIVTYLFLAELIRQTDMEPVLEIVPEKK